MITPATDPIITALLTFGKGILAADESFSTIEKRFRSLNIPSTPENRRAYRELLFTTPGLSESISGVILFDETIRQQIGGVPIPEALARAGIIPGIKVDTGTTALPLGVGERMTQGLDGLRERLAKYRGLGARFTKWRAVITIANGAPSEACLAANAASLALFAALSQEAGMIPIVEPEIMMSGDHTMERCEEIASAALHAVFDALLGQRVVLEKMLLKTGMVLAGVECPAQPGDSEVAEATLRCFRRSVPAAVPGIVFLSGGQAGIKATQRLNRICTLKESPWRLTFSFGRALQNRALETWAGSPGNVAAAQDALGRRARCNALAVQGAYDEQSERANRTT